MSSDAPPTLGDISTGSDLRVPTLNSTSEQHETSHEAPAEASGANGATLKDTVVNNAAAAVNSVTNHPVTQQTKETVFNGPVGTTVKDQTAKTGADISNLANARTPPSEPAATGQPLTHYHSFFYSLLSWEHKRATAIAFAATVAFIFAARYLKVLRFIFKTTYMVLGITAAAEVAGKFLLGTGLTSSIRPRRYYTVPKETLETALDDVEQLVNFFVIEGQRLLFAENPSATIGAFFAALVSYFLIRFVPLWGLSLLATLVIYLGPLIYLENKELIDGHLNNASDIINQQTNQFKDLAGQHTSRATETVKQYTGEYAAKAQEMIGTGKSRQKIIKENDFPAAPKGEFESKTPAAPEPVAA
ncbi:putative cell lysis protein [Phaeomoniella chlamydospora]|uniref:Reticulon-like protein n=1 Tax=Phaeomoniella chlamydospora TaxID=158046 RepID=A0A0G2F4L4_PHACM|nr:putative cell lysis protein [Phaeomoniella chlamydospora]